MLIWLDLCYTLNDEDVPFEFLRPLGWNRQMRQLQTKQELLPPEATILALLFIWAPWIHRNRFLRPFPKNKQGESIHVLQNKATVLSNTSNLLAQNIIYTHIRYLWRPLHCLFPILACLLTNNELQFVSITLTSVCGYLSVKNLITSSYRPQASRSV